MKKIIIYPDVEIWNYVLDGLSQRNDVILVPLNKYCNKFQLAMRRYARNQKLPAFFLIGERLREILLSLDLGDTVVLCDYTDYNLCKAITSVVADKINLKFWIWNPIGSNSRFKKEIQTIKSLGFDVYTFDEHDAKECLIRFTNQIYPVLKHIKEPPEDINSDFYFLGCDKNRADILYKLQEDLHNYICDFRVIDENSKHITYEENIFNVKHTRCIVDIVQGCQSGMTLRPLEALTFKKKLITNNQLIMKSCIYNKNNVFILGVDSIMNINEFMSSTYIFPQENVLNKFDVNYWIDKLSE